MATKVKSSNRDPILSKGCLELAKKNKRKYQQKAFEAEKEIKLYKKALESLIPITLRLERDVKSKGQKIRRLLPYTGCSNSSTTSEKEFSNDNEEGCLNKKAEKIVNKEPDDLYRQFLEGRSVEGSNEGNAEEDSEPEEDLLQTTKEITDRFASRYLSTKKKNVQSDKTSLFRATCPTSRVLSEGWKNIHGGGD